MLYDSLRCSRRVSVVLGRPAWREGEEGDWRTARYRVANCEAVSERLATPDCVGTHLGHSLDCLAILNQSDDGIPRLARQQKEQPPSEEPCSLDAEHSHSSLHPALILHEHRREELSRTRMEHERVGEATERLTLVGEERIPLLFLQLGVLFLLEIILDSSVGETGSRQGGDAAQPSEAEEGAHPCITTKLLRPCW